MRWLATLAQIYTYLYTRSWLTSRCAGRAPPSRSSGPSQTTLGAKPAIQLRRLQQGLQPDDAKPMASVGAGVAEIRIHTRVEHRVFYVAKFAEALYVLHAFEKRSRHTRQADLELGRRRLAEVLRYRREQGESP